MRARENLNLKAVPDGQSPIWYLPQQGLRRITAPELYVGGGDQATIAAAVDAILDEFIRISHLEKLYVTYRGRAGISNLVTSADQLALTPRHALFSFLGERSDLTLVRISAVSMPHGRAGFTDTQYEEIG